MIEVKKSTSDVTLLKETLRTKMSEFFNSTCETAKKYGYDCKDVDSCVECNKRVFDMILDECFAPKVINKETQEFIMQRFMRRD